MEIIDELKTVKKIINDRCSITRFGDGEIFHLFNRKFNNKIGSGRQTCTKEIREKLYKILLSNNPKILVGMSGYLTSEDIINKRYTLYTPYVKRFADKTKIAFVKKKLNKTYYSAEITRVNNLVNNKEIINLFDNFFKNNKFVFVGNKIVIKLIKNKFIDKFQQIDFIEVPKANAYQNYEEIKTKCLEYKDHIYLLAIGITATILSYDLALLNKQAIDIGHYFEQLNKLST